MQLAESTVRATIDVTAPGKHHGNLLVPDSRNDGAWSSLAVPIVAIGSGSGPTVLVMGGNHGDEYEGQVAVLKLAAEIEPDAVHGRLLLLPCLSPAASRAGTRLWPSGDNFNRSFPGDPGGSPAQQLADHLTRVLFPQTDVVVDIHSGGRSLLFHPMTTMTEDDSEGERRRRMIDAMLSWNADYHMSYAGVGGTGLLPAEAERQGKLVVTTEMGGGGFFTRAVLDVAERGLRNVLRHLGILEGEVETRASLGLPETVILRSTGPENYALAPASGLFETCVHPGDAVVAGQVVGRLHFPERPDWRAEPLTTEIDGIVAAIRAMPATRQGDVVATVAEVVDRPRIERPARG